MKRSLLWGLLALALATQAQLSQAQSRQAPAVSAVTNGASYSPRVSPGAFVAVFGDNLGDAPADTSVSVGEMNAPVLFVSHGQINVQFPLDLRPGPTTLTVTVRGVVSAPVRVDISAYAPALLTADSSGRGTGFFTSASSPANRLYGASPGQIIMAYAIGLGRGDVESPKVTVGGADAAVSFIGPARGLAAVNEIAFLVPPVDPGNQDMVISIGGVNSPPVTLPIGPATALHVLKLNPLAGTGPAPVTTEVRRPPAPSKALHSEAAPASSTIAYTCNANISATLCNTLNTTIASLYRGAFTNAGASIYIQFGSTGLGQSLTALNGLSYGSFRGALMNNQTDANDITAFSKSVPAANPYPGDMISLSNANMRALGFSTSFGLNTNGRSCSLGTSGCYDGLITVSSQENTSGNLYFRTGAAIKFNQYDFYSVVEHETDEVLGTASCLPGCSSGIAPTDLFRYHSDKTRSLAAGGNNPCSSSDSGNACFSIDGVSMLQQYNNLDNGDDFGDWLGNCAAPLVQDAVDCPGVANLDISPSAEILLLDVVGFTLTSATGVPDLTITKTHTGNFTQGQTGATYTITASNSGSSPTIGLVTVSDILPTGLTAASMTGTGWGCTQPAGPCTRADVLAGGNAYPAVTVTVNVTGSAPASVTNMASVSGGGEINLSNDTANDVTTILPSAVPDLTITKTHTGNFTQGQSGAAYTITISNSGAAPTAGTVTVNDVLPPGLAGASVTGTGWGCTQPAGPCTRTDVLAAGSSYPAITVLVNVAGNAPASVTNMTSVSGGGESNLGNDIASDVTTILAPPPALTITESHSGNFTQGETGATYTITVANKGAGPTSGLVTVADTTPVGMVLVSMAGTGWNCSGNSCTRSDTLAAGVSYPTLSATMNVAPNANSPEANAVSVSGGSSTSSNVSDSTVIVSNPPVLSIAKTHTGSFTQGQLGALYTVTVSNQAGAGPTSGLVTVADAPTSGLALVSMAGTGWNCTGASCTRSDVLNGGSQYPAITVKVNVAVTASSPQVNQASVSGGGAASNNASDSTVIVPGVTGTLSATPSGGSTFTYVAGTTSPTLPLGIASNPSGVTFTVAPSLNLISSITSAATPSAPSIAVSATAVITPGTQSGTITVSVPNSALNCASPVIVAGQSVCTVTAPFTINIQPSFFQGETSAGSGFFNLGSFGTYTFASYNPLTMYHISLGFEGIFPTSDANRGMYLYDDLSAHVWYTNPSLFPYFYDFNAGGWLFYFSGNATKGGRSFYNFGGTGVGFTAPGFIFL